MNKKMKSQFGEKKYIVSNNKVSPGYLKFIELVERNNKLAPIRCETNSGELSVKMVALADG